MDNLTEKDIQIITEIALKAHQEVELKKVCQLCVEGDAIERHHRHHEFIDRLEKLFDRLDNMKWKTFSGIIVTVVAALVLAFLSILWKLTAN